ncbi:MAG: PIN domain-containing protein [Bryobacteraceae bacterium]|nr:PIN domain-containing protein [Bryobacteraceae bacterium]
MPAASLCFVDTNILLYALDATAPNKQAAAESLLDQLWREGGGRTSWQVLHEFYVNATRKMEVPKASARRMVEAFTLWQPVDSSLDLIQSAWGLMDRASLNYWDALVVAAALRSGCRWLLTEDLQDGRRFGSLRIRNPFLPSA